MRRRLVLAIVLLAGLALSGCLGDPIDPPSDATLPTGQDEHHDEPAPPTEQLGPADVVLDAHAGMPDDELQLHPDPLRVPLGSIVEIRVQNQGSAPHTFRIHQFDADTGVLQPGEERSIKFRADEAGRFEIMCDVPGHYEAGMKSTLEVTA